MNSVNDYIQWLSSNYVLLQLPVTEEYATLCKEMQIVYIAYFTRVSGEWSYENYFYMTAKQIDKFSGTTPFRKLEFVLAHRENMHFITIDETIMQDLPPLVELKLDVNYNFRFVYRTNKNDLYDAILVVDNQGFLESQTIGEFTISKQLDSTRAVKPQLEELEKQCKLKGEINEIIDFKQHKSKREEIQLIEKKPHKTWKFKKEKKSIIFKGELPKEIVELCLIQ